MKNNAYRQTLVLHLLHSLGGNVSSAAFGNYAFLFCKWYSPEVYSFAPAETGARSFQLEADRASLIRKGKLIKNAGQFTLANNEECAPSNNFVETIFVAGFARKMRERNPLRELCIFFPEMATRVSDFNFNLTWGESRAIRTLTPPERGPGLLTIGCYGRQIESFIFELYRQGVSEVVDIRQHFSGRFGYSRPRLAKLCREYGIDYGSFPTIGCRRRSPEIEEINFIAERAGRCRVALLGYPRLAAECHRSEIADAIGGALHL